eukprot:gene10951-10794_t
MPALFAAAQADPKGALADLRMTVNGRPVFAHSWVVDARARALLDAVKECSDDDGGGYALDGNRRKAGLAVQTHGVLLSLVHWLYTARFPDDVEDTTRDALAAVAKGIPLPALDAHLAGIAGHHHRKADRAAAAVLDEDMCSLYAAIGRRRGVRREMCDVLIEPKDQVGKKGQQLPRAHRPLLCEVSPSLRKALAGRPQSGI